MFSPVFTRNLVLISRQEISSNTLIYPFRYDTLYCHTPNFSEHTDVVTAPQDFLLMHALISLVCATRTIPHIPLNLVTKIMASLVNYVQNITSQITIWNESRYLAPNVKLKTRPKQSEGRVENNGLGRGTRPHTKLSVHSLNTKTRCDTTQSTAGYL